MNEEVFFKTTQVLLKCFNVNYFLVFPKLITLPCCMCLYYSPGPVHVLKLNNKTEKFEQDITLLVFMKHHLKVETMLSTFEKF